MPHATFNAPDVTTLLGLDVLGLAALGQRVEDERVVIACQVCGGAEYCMQCGCQGRVRDTVVRRLSHVPIGWTPVVLEVRVRRYQCTGCARVWRQDTSRAAQPRSKLSRLALRWALHALVITHMTVARVAEGLAVSWNTANTAVLSEGKRVLFDDDTRFEGVRVIGVDEHVWRHTRRGDKYVTVIIDLTRVRDGKGPARLLDMVEGRSAAAFKDWLSRKSEQFRAGVVVAMDGFTGFKTAASEELPDAVAVMDPFHVVHLAGHALDECRRRVQHDTLGRRGRSGDPLYAARRTLHTGVCFLTERQHDRLDALFADERHVEVEVTWGIYQKMICAYRTQDKPEGKRVMRHLIETISHAVPRELAEVITLGRTLKKRAVDVLAYFDHYGTSNGPTEAINGRLEHLRGSALGFRNLTNYIARSLLETGGFKPQLHRQM